MMESPSFKIYLCYWVNNEGKSISIEGRGLLKESSSPSTIRTKRYLKETAQNSSLWNDFLAHALGQMAPPLHID